MSNLKTWSGRNFHCALSAFADQVNAGRWEKMPYYVWKSIKIIEETEEVLIILNTVRRTPYIFISNKEKEWTFALNDGSFGEFLYVNYFITTQNTQQDFNDEKENKEMKGFNFDFGPVNSDNVRMSMYGMAVKNKAGTYVSYDAKNGIIMDVDILNFNGSNFLYKMPVAIKDIAVGDVIVHQHTPMFVVDVPDNGNTLIAVDPIAGERKEIMLARSPFGFNFATKVVNFLGNMFNNDANADNPFGNMWMLMALQGDNNNFDSNMLLPMMMMNQGNVDPTMMLVFLAMKQNNNMDMLPLMFALQQNQHTCNCGQCKENK